MRFISRIVAGISIIRVFSFKDMLWQYAANFGVAVFGAVFILLLGRFLGARDFGIYAIAAATPAVVNAIFDYRIQEITIVLLNRRSSEKQRSIDVQILYALDMISRVFSFAISVAAGYVILFLYGFNTGITVPLVASLVILFAKAGNSTAMGVFRQAQSIKTYAILQSLDWASRVLILVLLQMFAAMDIEYAFYAQLVPAIAFNAMIILLSTRICKRSLALRRQANIVRHIPEFLTENRTILLSSQAISSVDAVVKELDTLVCGAFLHPQGIAVYKMAKNIASIAWKFVDPIFVIILPGISRYISDGKIDELSTVLKRSCFYLILASLVIFFASWGGSFAITYFVLGESYEKVPYVYPFISFWIIVALPFIWTHSVAIASGQAHVQALAGAVGNLAGLVALIVGAATFGVYGAAFGLSVAFAAPFALSFYLLVKKKIIRW
jgi:O-antigen/teichoic acid export membrane protein